MTIVCWHCWFLKDAVSHLYFQSPSLFRYTSPLTLTSSEVSRNRQQRTAIWRSMKPPIVPSFFSVPCPLFLRSALVPLSLNGRDGECVSVKSGGTGVLCEAKRGPFSPVVNEEAVQRVASPFLSPFLTPFLPSIPICPHIVVNKWMQSVVFMCVYVWPVPISAPLFCILYCKFRPATKPSDLFIGSFGTLCVPVWSAWRRLIGWFCCFLPLWWPVCVLQNLLGYLACKHTHTHTHTHAHTESKKHIL